MLVSGLQHQGIAHSASLIPRLLLIPGPHGLGTAWCLNGYDLGSGYPVSLAGSPAAMLRHSATVMGEGSRVEGQVG